MTPPKVDPRCCICGDAYGTRYVCSSCAADPANADWVEAPSEEVAFETIPQDAARPPYGRSATAWRPTAKFRRVALLLVQRPPLSMRQVAAKAKCSVSYVGFVVSALESLKKGD